jgi:type IV secretory pathway VirJ component
MILPSLLAALALSSSPAPVAAMPLALIPPSPAAAAPNDTLVVIYSGDGGWAALDRGLAAGFAKAGMPVVGVNSLRYFSRQRTPEGAAADLAALIERYESEWSANRVILVGYSFGADALPAIVPYLPAEVRAQLRLFALVSVFRRGELQFHLGDWFGHKGHESYETAPLINALSGLPMVCIYGADERDAACPTLPPEVIKQVSLPGGHHYDGAYGDIVREILAATPAEAPAE